MDRRSEPQVEDKSIEVLIHCSVCKTDFPGNSDELRGLEMVRINVDPELRAAEDEHAMEVFGQKTGASYGFVCPKCRRLPA